MLEREQLRRTDKNVSWSALANVFQIPKKSRQFSSQLADEEEQKQTIHSIVTSQYLERCVRMHALSTGQSNGSWVVVVVRWQYQLNSRRSDERQYLFVQCLRYDWLEAEGKQAATLHYYSAQKNVGTIGGAYRKLAKPSHQLLYRGRKREGRKNTRERKKEDTGTGNKPPATILCLPGSVYSPLPV